MGDSLQKRLEEMEHERPSLSEGTEAHPRKQTWKEKYVFWKRRMFGKVTSVPQKTETKENTTSKGCIDCRHNWKRYCIKTSANGSFIYTLARVYWAHFSGHTALSKKRSSCS